MTHASSTTAAISTAYLSWINEQLRSELERHRLEQIRRDNLRSDVRATVSSYLFASISMISLAALGAFHF